MIVVLLEYSFCCHALTPLAFPVVTINSQPMNIWRVFTHSLPLTPPPFPPQTVLTSWSTGLYTATDGGLSLRSAMVLLPSHWSTRACHPPVSGRPPAPPTQPAHMLISPPHPVFADAPWTQQSGGCGRQGDFIQMGVGFLESANTSSAHAVRAASQLVGEWGKYRWGLFSEAGYAGDNLYLPWYRQGPDWAATVCTDAHAGPPPCHPDHAHHCSWPPEAHRNATSSLLSLPNLPQVSVAKRAS